MSLTTKKGKLAKSCELKLLQRCVPRSFKNKEVWHAIQGKLLLSEQTLVSCVFVYFAIVILRETANKIYRGRCI